MSKEDKINKEDLEDNAKVDGELLDDDDDLQEGEEEQKEKAKVTFTKQQVKKLLLKEKENIKNSFLKELGLEKNDSSKIKEFVSFLGNSKEDKKDTDSEKIKELERRINEQQEKSKDLQIKNVMLEKGINKKYSQIATVFIKQQLNEQDADLEEIVDDMMEQFPDMFVKEKKEEENPYKMYGTGTSLTKSKGKSSADNSNSISARLIEARKNEQSSVKSPEGWKNDF